MRANPVRAEFVLPGLSLLLAITWLIAALNHPGEGFAVFDGGWSSDLSSGAGLLILAGGIGVGYALGALVVQITFDALAKQMRRDARDKMLRTLKKTNTALSDPAQNTPSGTGSTAGAAQLLKRILSDKASENECALLLKLAEDFARLKAGAEITREIEYRRANRQVFLGILPSVPLAAVAACVTVISSGTVTDIATIVLASILGVLAPIFLLKGAAYQEETIERLLLNVLFIEATGWTSDKVVD